MTYRDDSTLSTTLLEQLTTNGLDALPDLFRVLLNAAMQIERQNHLGAALHERTEQRTGHANGYKDKILATRLGQITVAVPQVREGGFYPQSLERGTRSERALKLALAEMYVQGVSTRKVAAITEQLCGFAVSSGQVSQAASVRRPQSGGQGTRCHPGGLAQPPIGRVSIPIAGRSLRESTPGRHCSGCRRADRRGH